MEEPVSGEECDRDRIETAERDSDGVRFEERSRPLSDMALATGPLDRRLALHSLVLALGPAFEVTAAADSLAALADSNRTALLRAIARVRGGVGERSGPTADRAAAALRLALERFGGPDAAGFLVGLQEQVLDAFASLYLARADSTDDGNGLGHALRPALEGDRFRSPGGSS